MTDERTAILIVEDEDDHYELIHRTFERSAGEWRVERARNLQEAAERQAVLRPALVIADWKLPDGDGIELIGKRRHGAGACPVLVMTSHGNEAWAVEAMRRGALDYIVKSPEAIADIPRIAGRALKEWKNICERKAAENALQEEKEFTETAINTMPGVFFVLDGQGRYVRWNRSLEDLLGITDASLRGRDHLESVHPEDRDFVRGKITEVLATGYAEGEARLLAGEADARTYLLTFRKMYSQGGSYLVGSGVDVSGRKLTEETIRRSREHISLIFNSTAEGIYGTDRNGICTFCNAAGLRMLGYDDEKELLGKNIHETIHHTRESAEPYPIQECPSRQVLTRGSRIHAEREYLWRRDGKGFPVEFWAYPLITGGQVAGSVCTFIDITNRIALENQLQQAQKMEAIGILAGGVAHDFNNILTAIIGYGYLLQRKLKNDDPLRVHLDQILGAANRGATLTQSLLAFSRKQKQVIDPKQADLNEIIRRLERFLGRIIGEEVALTTSLCTEPLTVLVDTAHLEQVLMNLSVNARDAMPGGGSLVIRTERVALDDAQVLSAGLDTQGVYGAITVSDTGTGIDCRVKDKIFEPFFTTKEAGKGTGLGLSIVYGIVRQNKGHISVESDPGKGTSFRIYLPLAHGSDVRAAAQELPQAPGGTETILIAEDDAVVRTITRQVLEEAGYTVVEAEQGEEAVRKFTEQRDRISLLILDVIMPLKNGSEVYDEARKIKPGIKALFTSGYPADLIRKEGVLEHGRHFLPKPAGPEEILGKVRRLLDHEQ